MRGALRTCVARFAGLFRRSRRDDELSAEIESNLQLHTDANLRAGMSPGEARRVALLKFGGVEAGKEAYREQRGIPLLEHGAQDLSFALRQFAKRPGFAGTALFVLALGICASAAIFALVEAVLIRPLPYPAPQRIAAVTETVEPMGRANLSYEDYRDWKRLNHVFESLEVYTGSGFLLKTPGGMEPVTAAKVSTGFFRVLGTAPVLGNVFPGGHGVLISYAGWQKRFGGRQDVIGQPVVLNGESHQIVGVLPRGFEFAPRANAEFWTTFEKLNYCEQRRGCHNLYGIARLKEGVSIAAANSAMKQIAAQLEREYPGSNRGQGAIVEPLSEIIVGDLRPILLVLLAGALLLLSIAYINVASLLLVRAESRRREMAVRASLGASRGRLFRQFLTEGLVLAAGSAALGIVGAHWTIRLLIGLIPEDMARYMPYLQSAGLNPMVLAFAGLVCLIAALLFALTPVLCLPAADMRGDMADGGRGSAGTTWRRFGSRLVVIELAAAMVLLAGAGLLGKSLYRLLNVNLGFQPDHLAVVEVAAHTKDGAENVQLGRQIVERLSRLPGVTDAAISTTLPVTFNGNTTWIRIVGQPYHGEHNETNERDVSSGYFKTLHARLLAGRYYSDTEDAGKPKVVIINETLARKFFPGQNPLGQKIGNTDLAPDSLTEVVGVVADIREGALDSEIWPAVYYPFNQNSDNYFSVVVRTTQNERSVLPAMVAAIHEINPDLGTIGPIGFSDRIQNSASAYLHRSSAWLVGGFATLALLLSAVGLYGVVTYSVSQRVREIGVRIALGAKRSAVYSLILREAGRLTVIGIGLGAALSLGLGSLMTKVLFGVRAWDGETLLTVAIVLALAALAASFVPARRASKVDPVDALRAE